MKQISWLLFLLTIMLNAAAQTGTAQDSIVRQGAAAIQDTVIKDTIAKDTTRAADTARSGRDTVIASKAIKAKPRGESYMQVIRRNPFFNFFGKPMVQTAVKRADKGKEGQFYLLSGIIFCFALIKVIFNKYLHNLFAVFFRVSMKQKQIREQLQQTPFPSLLLNLLFVVTGGIYAVYLLRYYHVLDDTSFWVLLLYCSVALSVVYIAKMLVLKLTGWIFNMREAADTYIFIVFLVNKLLGIFLLPLLLFMAFSQPAVVSVVVTLSYVLVLIFFAYRYIISFGAVRSEIKVSQFHFFLYLCAFEIIPLVLIYKVLLDFVYRSH